MAVAEPTIGLPRLAASSSLFLMPPPLTNGKTTTACRAISSRRSGRSANQQDAVAAGQGLHRLGRVEPVDGEGGVGHRRF